MIKILIKEKTTPYHINWSTVNIIWKGEQLLENGCGRQ